jgi:hypothetical protein
LTPRDDVKLECLQGDGRVTAPGNRFEERGDLDQIPAAAFS